MSEESCRLPSVKGQVAWRGTPPKVSSFGVIVADKLLAIGLRRLAEFGVELGLILGSSFFAADPWYNFNGGKFTTRADLEGEMVFEG